MATAKKNKARRSATRRLNPANKNLLMGCFAAVFAALATVLLAFGSAATAQTSFSGTLSKKQPLRTHSISTTVSGSISATATTAKGAVQLTLTLKQGTTVISQNTGSPASISAPVSSGTFTFEVSAAVANPTQYTLNVTYPVPDPAPSADTTPPSAPANLTANPVSGSQINLSWQSSTDNVGVSGYTVYRNGVALSTSMTTMYSDVNLSPGTTYNYLVKARDAAGNFSAASNTATATTPAPVSDSAAPTVTISSPVSGATVAGTINVSGTAKDNAAVSRVDVQIDGSGVVPASYNASTFGWTYNLNTTLYVDGSHTLTAKATDSSGNVATTTSGLVIKNNTGTSAAPNTQGTWVSPEGATIIVNSAGIDPATGQPWTIAGIYNRLKAQVTANATVASDFVAIAPVLRLNVQDVYSTMTTTMVGGNPGSYSDYSASIYFKGINSTFPTWPNYVLSHEYGIAWGYYHLWIIAQQGSWSVFANNRADNSTYNGVTYPYLGQDPRLGTTQTWQPAEIIADDYRLLFGSSSAISERNYNVNTIITDPRNQPGYANWLLNSWK